MNNSQEVLKLIFLKNQSLFAHLIKEYHGSFDEIAEELSELGITKENLPLEFPTEWEVPDRNTWYDTDAYLIYITPDCWVIVEVEEDINEEGVGVEGKHSIWENKIFYLVKEPVDFQIVYNPLTWEVEISQ